MTGEGVDPFLAGRLAGSGAVTDTDVVIVGGGPAGLYAGLLLAGAGVRVEVVEEHERIGEPTHCTGILGVEALQLPGVPADAVLGQPCTARFHSPAGHCLEYAGPEGEVRVVDRAAFDRSLANAAVAAGARVLTGSRAVRLVVEPHGVVVETWRAGQLASTRASVCLLACGASYRFQRDLGWGLPGLFLSSAQTEVGAAGGEELDIFLRPDLTTAGFAWLVPVRRGGESRAKVGVMAPRRAGRALDRVLAELTMAGRIAGPPGRVISRLLPLGPLRRTYGDRVLAVGDAAGLVKPTTGGGIYYSLLSARWAAETVVAAFERGEFSARTLGGYEERWRAHLGRELSVGVWFRRLAERLTPGDLDALTELAIRDGVIPIVRRAARFNWHRELILQTLRHPEVFRIVLRRLWPWWDPARA